MAASPKPTVEQDHQRALDHIEKLEKALAATAVRAAEAEAETAELVHERTLAATRHAHEVAA